MTKIIDTINQRISVREYDAKALSLEQLAQIEEVLNQEIETPFKSKPRFNIINVKAFAEQEKVKLGTYGFIKGAQHFIVGVSPKSDQAMIDYGFALEKIILELTELGYGTCWLGGAFSRAKYAKTISMNDEEVIPAITPVGIGKQNTLRGRIIRTMAGSKKRKPFDDLFFAKEINQPITEIEDNYREALNMARLAPSADNFQPWRVIVDATNTYHFYLKRNPILKKTIKSADLQLIDMGIAMAHFQLSLKDMGKAGSWIMDNENLDFNVENLEYIGTWQ